MLWQRVERTLQLSSIMAMLADAYRQDDENPAALRRDALVEELRVLAKEKDNLRRRIRQAGDDELQAIYEQDMKEVLTRERSLQHDVAQAETECADWQHMRDTIARLVTLHQDVQHQADGAWSYADKRLVLYILGVRVTVWRKGHTPRWKIHALPLGNRLPIENDSTIIFPLPIDFVEPPQSPPDGSQQ